MKQYRPHPKPRSAGIVRRLREHGDERELFLEGAAQLHANELGPRDAVRLRRGAEEPVRLTVTYAAATNCDRVVV